MTRRPAESPTLASALEAASFGFLVFPLWWPREGGCACRRGQECRNPGKHPRISDWQDQATTDEATIRAWWRRWPDANVGILTGARGGLVVLDFDPGDSGTDSLAVIEGMYGPLPETVQVLSGRHDEATGRQGVHLYFRHPGDDVRIPGSVRTLAPDVDVRGEGGLVVGPGSLHASGRRYEWEAAHHPTDVPVADLGAALALALTRRPSPAPGPAATAWEEPPDLPPLAERIRRAKAWLAQRPPAIQGQAPRGGSAYTLGTCVVVVRGFALFDEEAALEALADWNALCQPPWDERPDAPGADSLRKKIRDARNSSLLPIGAKLGAQPRARVGTRASGAAADTEAGSPGGDDDADGRPRPEIVLAGDLEMQAETLLDAVVGHNDPPHLFVRGRQVVRIVPVYGVPRIDALDRTSLRAHLGHRFQFFKSRRNKETGEVSLVLTDLPLSLPEYVLQRETWPLPALRTVIHNPAFSRDGRLVTEDGYHGDLQVFLDAQGLRVTVPDDPTDGEVAAARALILDELLHDFPFVDDAARAHAVALGLGPFVRFMFAGPTPLHLITAPSEGVGKTKLARALCFTATGQEPATMTQMRDDDEWRKRITTTLMSSPTMVLIDNLQRRLDSPTLASVLTSEMWTDRVLGRSESVTLQTPSCWTATGNNLPTSREIARRSVWIPIDPRVEQPWRRTGFRHHPLEAWIQANRAELVRAFLVLVRRWVRAGMPPGQTLLGSYEGWSATLGGILATAGIPGFLANLDAFYDRMDNESGEWRAFVAAWWDAHGANPVAVADLHALATQHDLLGAALGDGNERSQKTRLGKALSSRLDRIVGDRRIVRTEPDTHTKIARYRLQPVEDRESGGAEGRAAELAGQSGLAGHASSASSNGHYALPHSEPPGEVIEL